jgi:hypothetical protein
MLLQTLPSRLQSNRYSFRYQRNLPKTYFDCQRHSEVSMVLVSSGTCSSMLLLIELRSLFEGA